MSRQNNITEFYAKDRAAWRRWLLKYHMMYDGVWLTYDKGPHRTMQWSDIVQEALCFGWIDSKPAKLSETQSKIYVSKRKHTSVWSKINKQHVIELQECDLLMPAGLAAIKAAKANGSWDALNDSDNLIVPPELAAAFKQNQSAHKNFESFSNSSKRIILEWIYSAKRDETRTKRIEETVRLAKLNQKANHHRQYHKA